MNLEIAWAAGVFEGDGSIVERYGRPRLQLIMCERESVDRFHRAVGVGKVYGPYGNAAMEARDGYARRPRWFWLAEKGEAETALYLLTPHFSLWRRAKNVETGAPVVQAGAAEIDRYVADWRAWVERDVEGEDGPPPVIGITLLDQAARRVERERTRGIDHALYEAVCEERDALAALLADRDRRIAALREVFRDE